MKPLSLSSLRRLAATLLLAFCFAIAARASAGLYTNFSTAVYIPVGVLLGFYNPQQLNSDWERISAQLKVDKVYIEVQRDRTIAKDDLIVPVKKFFAERGVSVAGGMALSDGGDGQFRSFCYTDPEDRAFIKRAVEQAAKHFDEVIQDDFFFVTTKFDSDIAAKGDRSWSQFRLDLMNEASENLLIKPARAVNPKVKMVIKYPNWYEHFHGSGFDLVKQPRLFDGIYIGTETRDPEITDQNLQQYESYQIMRYFENIKPGGNGGGWVDTFSVRYVDRYAEQLWNTLFAKTPEITLFEWSAMTKPIVPGDRAAWEKLPTSFNLAELRAAWKTNAPASMPEPTIARAAGYSLEQVDAFLGKLGHPIGIASYRPAHAWGEDFLHNYFGMIGIPIDLHPTFPTNASTVLLTEAASFDLEIVAKVKGQLRAGKTVVITSGLLRALQGKGIEDIVELQYTDRKIMAREYLGGFGAGDGVSLGGEQADGILFPDIRFLTNDAWPVMRALANGRGYPLLLMERYGKGVLYVWTMPDNFNDLYRLPPAVTSELKGYLMAGFPVRLEGPSQVALFAYDNNTFIAQSYRHEATEVVIKVVGKVAKLRNVVTDEVIAAEVAESRRGRNHTPEQACSTFKVHLLPHSYSVFAAEPGVLTVNGQKAGDQFLAPGWSDYNTRIQSQTYDVNSLVSTGTNVIGVMQADGWYRGKVGLDWTQAYGSQLAFIEKIKVTSKPTARSSPSAMARSFTAPARKRASFTPRTSAARRPLIPIPSLRTTP